MYDLLRVLLMCCSFAFCMGVTWINVCHLSKSESCDFQRVRTKRQRNGVCSCGFEGTCNQKERMSLRRASRLYGIKREDLKEF